MMIYTIARSEPEQRLADGASPESHRAEASALRNAARWVVATSDDGESTAGPVLLPHGAQHALGWFGGYGFCAPR